MLVADAGVGLGDSVDGPGSGSSVKGGIDVMEEAEETELEVVDSVTDGAEDEDAVDDATVLEFDTEEEAETDEADADSAVDEDDAIDDDDAALENVALCVALTEALEGAEVGVVVVFPIAVALKAANFSAGFTANTCKDHSEIGYTARPLITHHPSITVTRLSTENPDRIGIYRRRSIKIILLAAKQEASYRLL